VVRVIRPILYFGNSNHIFGMGETKHFKFVCRLIIKITSACMIVYPEGDMFMVT